MPPLGVWVWSYNFKKILQKPIEGILSTLTLSNKKKLFLSWNEEFILRSYIQDSTIQVSHRKFKF